jgi:cytochrome P450
VALESIEPMAHTEERLPPGPRGIPFLGVSLEFRRDPLKFLTHVARDYGDVAYIPLGFGQGRILLNRPDFIGQLLVLEQHKFHKTELMRRVTTRILGEGLLTSDGEFWRRQRRLSQPAFHRTRIVGYARTMVEKGLAHIESWQDGAVLDVAGDMMRLTMGIAVKTLFGSEVDSQAARISQSLATVMRYEMHRLRSPWRLPGSWPSGTNRRASEAYEYLDSVVYRIISDRRAHHEMNNDLLSLLIASTDEDGSQMTPKQLRDETMTLFLAGHETTALALSWAWYLLSENARTEICLHEELGRVLGGRTPQVEDLERMPYLDAVIRESLRLYPPAYLLGRSAIAPVVVGGYNFPVGTTFLMSPWVTHRDPRYFEGPEVFRPERWLDGLAQRLPPHAYFPFGGGPRRCIGQGFALMEAALLLATIAQRYWLRTVADHAVAPEPLVTLRAKNGIRMVVHARS